MSLARKRLESPASLLHLWHLADDTIVTTEGCYVCGFKVEGLDSEHLPSEVLSTAAERLYQAAKSELREDTFFQFTLRGHGDHRDVWERCAAMPRSADPVLEHQRARRLEFLQAKNLRRFALHAYVGSRRGFSRREFATLNTALHAERLAEAKTLGRALTAVLGRVGVKTCAVAPSALLDLSFAAANPGLRGPAPRPSAAPSVPPRALGRGQGETMIRPRSLRERLFEQPIVAEDDFLKISTYHKVLSLTDLPDATHFTLTEIFLQLRYDFRLTTVVAFPRQSALRSTLKVFRRLAHADAHRETHVPDPERLGRMREANVLSALLADTHQKLVMMGLQLVLSAETPEALARITAEVMEYLRPFGFGFAEETGRHDVEYYKTLPGMAATFDRWKLVPSNNAVDLLPLFSPCHGDHQLVFLMETARGELFSYDPMEPRRDNWNACVLGAPGSGKSVFMNMLITTAMLAGETKGRLVVVDFAGPTKSSYLMIAKLFRGQFLPILGPDVAINPFPPRRLAMPNGTPNRETLAFLLLFTDLLLTNTGEAKEEQLYRNILQRAILDAYADIADPEDAPTYSDLRAVLGRYRGHPDIDSDRLRVLLDLVDGFLASPDAALFNRRSTIRVSSDFAIFDLFGIDGLRPPIQQAIAYLVCHYVKQLAFDASDPGRKYVVLDEVAQLLRRPEMRALVHELYSTSRKHNTSVWTVTQRYGDYKASELHQVINLNSTTQIFLTHADAAPVREEIVKDFSMNEREAFLFENLRTEKGVYSEALLRTDIADSFTAKRSITSKIRIALSPFDYELATSDATDRERQRRAIAANPGRPLVEVLDHLAGRRVAARRGSS